MCATCRNLLDGHPDAFTVLDMTTPDPAAIDLEQLRLPRIFGIETEYGVLQHPMTADDTTGRVVYDQLAKRIVKHTTGHRSGRYMPNGSRMYVDVGSHPEYATPECASAADATVAMQAGDLLLADTARHLELQQASEHAVPLTITLLRNNTDTRNETFGAHENYLVRTPAPATPIADKLLPHMVSRIIFTGAGWWRQTAGTREVLLSQRSTFTKDAVSSSTTRMRPLINTRNEPHADPKRHARLHVIGGDSNVAPAANWMKLATTGLVLLLVEHDKQALDDLQLADPIAELHQLDRCDGDGRPLMEPLRLADGRKLTPVELQQELADRVSDLDGALLTERRQLVLNRWQTLLHLLDTNPDELFGIVDWITKRRLLTAARHRRNLADNSPVLTHLDMTYHDVRPERSIFWRTAGRQLPADWQPPAAFTANQAMVQSPSDTRAAVRSAAIKAAAGMKATWQGDNCPVSPTINWDRVMVTHPNGMVRVSLPDPYATDLSVLDEFLQVLEHHRN